MRVLHVTDVYAPRVGGIERQVQSLAEQQASAGHDVSVVTRVAGPAGSPAAVVVHRPRSRWSPAKGLSDGVRAVLDSGADVVHVHASVLSPLGFLTAAAAGRGAVPTVVTVHSLWSRASSTFRCADRLVGWRDWPVVWSAVSSVAAAQVQRVLGEHHQVHVLPNGVDPDAWQATPQPAPSGPVVVVGVMRLAPRKRPLTFVRVLAQARRQLPAGVQLSGVLVGDGPLRALVEREVHRQGAHTWLTLAGQLAPGEIRELHGSADLFLNPTRLESFGIAALEARCAGLPVVALAHSGVRDFVTPGREGLLAGSDAGLAAAVRRLVEDAALRQRIGRHNATVPTGCTWSEVQRRCEDLYALAATRCAPSHQLASAKEAA